MNQRTSNKFTHVLVVCLSILPACLILALIRKYGVDVPHWDEWEYVAFFQKLSQGTLTLGDLFAQQNEFRQFFPNLIFVALGSLTKWDKRYELLVSFALACAVSINIYRLEIITIGGSTTRRLVIYFLTNLLIFSPVQYQNWLLGMQIVYFMPIACVTTCLVIIYSQLNTGVKLLLCMGLATISSFSSANGILCWLIVFPLLSCTTAPRETHNRKWLMLVWIAAFVACATLYFGGYHSIAGHPSLSESLIHPLKALSYFLVLAGKAIEPGEPLSVLGLAREQQKIVSGITGLLLVALFVSSAFFLQREIRRDGRAAAWVMLGIYSIATAFLVTLGRAGYGVEQALSSRYTTFTLYLPIALLHLIPIALDREVWAAKLARVKRKLLLLLAGVVVALQLIVYPYYIRHMSLFNHFLAQSKACLLLINVVADEHCLKTIHPNIEFLKQAANSLDGLGYLRPGLLKTNKVQDIAIGTGQPDVSYGSLDSVIQAGDDSFTATGWALLTGWDRPADAILLSYDIAEGNSIIFAVAGTEQSRGLLARIWHSKLPSEYARWKLSFSLSQPPTKPVIIRAWAFDSGTGKAAPLAGKYMIPEPAATDVK